MAQRNSGYARIAGDNYATPAWPVELLLGAERFPQPVYEPAPGDGYMVATLQTCGMRVIAFPGEDFFASSRTAPAIITNPPFDRADEFVRHALKLTEPELGKVAMLLPISFDTAKGRKDIFADHPAFARKLILTRRIRWANIPQMAAGPSMNHAWYVWCWRHVGPPTLRWAGGLVEKVKKPPATDQLDLVKYIECLEELPAEADHPGGQ